MSGKNPIRRIDAHHHLWNLTDRPQDWITGPSMAAIDRSFLLEEFEALAIESEVDASVLVQTVCEPEETPELLAIAASSSIVQAVVGWVDLEAPGVADQISALKESPGGGYLRGIRHQVQGENDPEWLARPAVRRGLIAVAAAGLNYEFIVRPDQLPAVAKTAHDFPEAPFILDHAGKPPIAAGELEAWFTDITAVASASNITCKVSGLLTEANWSSWTVSDVQPIADRLLELFGVNRLMLGSDWPVSTLAASYRVTWSMSEELIATLSAAEKSDLRQGTAAKVYRIPGTMDA